MGYIGTFPKNTTAVQGIPIGKLNQLINEVANLSAAFPQMTTAQKLASSPINGSTVFDTTLQVPQIYISGYWATLLLQ